MSRSLILVYLTSLAYCKQTQFANENVTYFHNNKQRCNCEYNVQCNDEGICPSGTCAYHYVGINCQHVSLALTLTSKANLPLELQDQDSTTCVGESSTHGTVTFLTKRIHLFWIYIIHKEDKPVSLNLKAHDNNRIFNKTIFTSLKISKNAMLIKFNMENKLNKLITRLEIDNFSNVCILEVGIGRNLAMTGMASQSSQSNDYANSRTAFEAIDGFEGTSFSMIRSRSCTETSKGETVAWWRVRLIENANVNLITLTNQANDGCRLMGFVLETITEDKKVAHWYNDTGSIEMSKYTIVVADYKLIREVKVTIESSGLENSCDGRGILTLCEVQIFGEFVCPNGMFGASCDINCPGCPKDGCDPDWGCLRGCLHGWKGPWCMERVDRCDALTYGPNCEHKCAENCANEGLCEEDTGKCIHGCKPGFYPPDCRNTCESGWYDLNCSKLCEQCSKNFTTGKHVCNPHTGHCPYGCSKGFYGDMFCDKISFHTQRSALGNILNNIYTLLLIVVVALLIVRQSRRGREKDAFGAHLETHTINPY